MIADLKRYPATKDSGVPWLGDVPAHWEVRRNGRLFAQRNETGFPDLPILEVSLRTGVRIRDFESSDRKQVMSEKKKYKRARRADIAYNMMRMWQGAVGLAPVDGLVSPAYVVAKPLPGTESRYFEFLFRTDAYMAEVNNYSRGIVSDRNRLYWDEFKQIPSPYPPLAEQAAIARFLDHADRRIRHYIRAKQKLIKLLEEQKQAIIHRAVSRGLDPNVRLKPSGMEWLGDVPEHWEVWKLKRLARLNPSRSEYAHLCESNELVTFLPMERVSTRGEIDASQRLPIRDLWHGFTYFRRGDVLLAKITPCFENGKGACLTSLPTEIGFGTTEFIVLRAASAIRPEFLYQVTHLAVFRSVGVESMTGSAGQQRISQNFVANFEIPVPPISEQAEILQAILDGARQIDSAIARATSEISLLREYRTRLIADVVTGKLDVRAAAAILPDEADEPETPDDSEVVAEGEETATDGDLDAAPEEAEA